MFRYTKYKILFYKALILLALLSIQHIDVMAQEKFEALQYPYEIHTIDVMGLEMAYADEGEGEVILFIHGLGSYAPAWKKNIEELKKEYRCIIVDLPGYGKSEKGKFDANMTFHSTHLLQLMEQLGIGKYTIAGHSMGAQVAMHMALRQPEKINSLILIAPAGIETFTPQEKAIFKTTTPAAVASVSDEQYHKNLVLNFYSMPEDARFMYNDRLLIKDDSLFMDYCHVVVQGIFGMLDEPVFERLPDIKQPTLILYGKEDKLIPNPFLHPGLTTESIAKLAGERLSNAIVKIVDKAGHFLNFEQHEVVNNHIKRFLINTKTTDIK